MIITHILTFITKDYKMRENPILGASLDNNKTTFRFHAPNATLLELCLFSADENTETRIPLQKDEEGNWVTTIDCNLEGQKYGLRAYGEYNPDSLLFFNPHKLLVDPYAKEITKSLHNISTQEKIILKSDNSLDSRDIAPKSVVRFLDKKR